MSGVLPLPRSLVLVGLMGAGKSAIGRRLAQHWNLPFADADRVIEEAAGLTIPEIFARLGEPAFRDGERRVIARLLEGPVQVIATGGGAFMDAETRAAVKARGVSLWLKADLDVLARRVTRRTDRPLLKGGEPREILARLMQERYPTYAEADITVESSDGPPEMTVDHVVRAVEAFIARRPDLGAAA